jgi:hypothetical protein
MNRQEDEEYPIQQMVAQEQSAPSTLAQAIATIAFISFIVGLPTIIEKLSK